MTLHLFLRTLILSLLFSTTANGANVVVVDSYAHDFAWVRNYHQGLEEVLQQHQLLSIELNTKKIPAADFEDAALAALSQITMIKPDLVILADDNATRLLGPSIAAMQIPLVYLGVNGNPRTYDLPLSPKIAGVLERPLFRRALLMLNNLLPSPPQKILVMFDRSETSNRIVASELSSEALTNLAAKVDVRQFSQWTEWQQAIREAPAQGYQAVVVGLYQTLNDEQGAKVSDIQVMAWMHQNCQLPPFAFWDFSVGPEALIGGLVMSGHGQGAEAGKLALMLLGGATPPSLPATPEQGQLLFSAAALRHWGLDLRPAIRDSARIID